MWDHPAQETLVHLSATEQRALLNASAGLVKRSKALCQRARDLRADTADLREFMRESRLQVRARLECWRD